MLARSLKGLVVAIPFAFAVATSAPGDDLRVRQLENEVMRLQRELDAQSQRIDRLERAARANINLRAPASVAGARSESSPAWLIGTNWDRIRPGMKELDVIALLGRPNSVRADPDGKVRSLLYAMELGPTAVLAGSVQLTESGVTEINKPKLR